MKNILLILFSIFLLDAFSQENLLTGKYEQFIFENNVLKTKIVTNPLINPGQNRMIYESQNNVQYSVNASTTRWSYIEPAAIANDLMVSGNGQTGVCGWALNNKRVSAYGNTNFVPFWQFMTSSQGNRNYVSISDTAVIAVGSYQNIYLFDKNSNIPFFNFDLTTLPDVGTAGPVGITSNGGFIIATSNRSDTSTVIGYNKSSTVSVWKLRVPTSVYGVKISGNDSLAIISTYSYYWVVNTYTGVIRYAAAITDGTQMTQGISGNGDIIATTAYNFLWQYQEPPGSYYNWFTAVDISYDGSYIAGGTLIFLSSSTYDGRLRYFKVSNGSTPLWSYVGLLDGVYSVSFSKNGKILAVASYGDIPNTKNDLYIFKTSVNSNSPIYMINMPGSPYVCSASNDGTTVLAGGKAVHARVMGSGGTLYNIFVDTAETPLKTGNISGKIPNEYKLEQNYPI
ncbi:MAG: WD40 repeat domain-containing protein [Ignavibacteriae bacterium]|nr:WD40 repeat domain-containing protein [Ignavibacteriota bacterium]